MALNFPHVKWEITVNGADHKDRTYAVAAFDDQGRPWVAGYTPGVGARLVPADELGVVRELYPAY